MHKPFKAPIMNGMQKDQTVDFSSKIIYKCFYSKQIKKKKKIFEDGLLVYTQGMIEIYDMEGKKICAQVKTKGIIVDHEPGDQFILAQNLIEVGDQIPQSQFETGQIFIRQEIFKKPLIKQVQELQQKFNDPRNIRQQQNILPDGAYLLSQTDGNNICYIEAFLAKKMRDHQKQGVKFMIECVTGIKSNSINGCILADSMGLGKTLQSIALIWTLLKQNPFKDINPFVRKCIIIAPVTLIKNWANEIIKWLGSERIQPIIAMGSQDDVQKNVNNFAIQHQRLLLISYESFRTYCSKLRADLLIFDEGHRLKNANSKTLTIFQQFPCKRRIILTGTPLQNNLEEFFTCVNFVNPGILGSMQAFKKVFVQVIMRGKEKNALQEQKDLAKTRSSELSYIVSSMILRRQSDILEKLLPSKFEYLVFVKLSDIQIHIYQKIIDTKFKRNEIFNSGFHDCLSFIQYSRKLLNHPQLVQIRLILKLFNEDHEIAQEFKQYFPKDFRNNYWPYSYKFVFTIDLLMQMEKDEKLIIVSYFTSTLDLLEYLLIEAKIQFLRLDGQVQPSKRQSLVDSFNNQTSEYRVFLLCAKAGGVGLNLIGANKMILFDVDWNPSNDQQVMARIWRDGQKKQVFIYRLISVNTLEEKILQRQQLKETLSDNILDEKDKKFDFDDKFLKQLFEFDASQKCKTFQQNENKVHLIDTLAGSLNDKQSQYIAFIKTKESELQNALLKDDFFLEQFDESFQNKQDDDLFQKDEENLKPIMIDQNLFDQSEIKYESLSQDDQTSENILKCISNNNFSKRSIKTFQKQQFEKCFKPDIQINY